jgi:hypothetical protein
MTTNKFLLFCFIVILYILSGCCQAECNNRIVTISFRKLRTPNADSVSILSYQPGSHFTQRLDSNFIHMPVAATDTNYSSLYHSIIAERDWKIINHSLNKEYRLNNFEIEKLNCCGERAYVVRSFAVNGAGKEGDFFDIE